VHVLITIKYFLFFTRFKDIPTSKHLLNLYCSQ